MRGTKRTRYMYRQMLPRLVCLSGLWRSYRKIQTHDQTQQGRFAWQFLNIWFQSLSCVLTLESCFLLQVIKPLFWICGKAFQHARVFRRLAQEPCLGLTCKHHRVYVSHIALKHLSHTVIPISRTSEGLIL